MKELSDLLRTEDPIETEQRLNNGININDFALKFSPGIIPKIPEGHLFDQSYVSVTKQHRYSYMPAHSHDFLEFNYQFSGTSDQIINGRTYTMKAGQLLIMDQDVIQKYGYMGENDLLVNILLDLKHLPDAFSADIGSIKDFNSLLYSAQSASNGHENFLIYDLSHLSQVKQLWEQLIYYSLTQMQPFLTRELLMKAALSCLPTPNVSNIQLRKSQYQSMSTIIKYIETNYKTTSLEQVCAEFGYNKNYLGNKIKSYTGMTFVELLDRERLVIAESLLWDTQLSLTEIAYELGYKNASSLFRLFQNKIGKSPQQFRKQKENKL